MKFCLISHILVMLEIQVIATLAPPIFAKRPCSAIYFSVKNIKIGPEMAKWRGFSFQKHAILGLFAHFFRFFGIFRSTSFFRIAIVRKVFGAQKPNDIRGLRMSMGLLKMSSDFHYHLRCGILLSAKIKVLFFGTEEVYHT